MSTDFLQGHGDGGRENIDLRDLKKPYLSICAKTSSAVNKNKKEAYVEGLEVGDFYNTLTKEVFGKKISLIYLHHFISWDEYAPGGGDFVGRHVPGSIPVSDTWPMKSRDGNDVKEVYNFVVLIKGREDQGPVFFTVKGSGIKHAKSWLNSMYLLKLENGEPCPLFGGVWELESLYNEKSGNDWFTFGVGKNSSVKHKGFVTEKVFKEAISPNLEMVKTLGVKAQGQKAIESPAEDLDNF